MRRVMRPRFCASASERALKPLTGKSLAGSPALRGATRWRRRWIW